MSDNFCSARSQICLNVIIKCKSSFCIFVLYYRIQTQGIMKFIGNIIWVVFGGLIISIEYLLASIPFFISIIGIPFGIQSLKLASVALCPFGKKIEKIETSTGCLSTFMNILWFFIGGVWICLTHFGFGLLFYITIIGIPFGSQHMKLARLALTPFGRTVVGR